MKKLIYILTLLVGTMTMAQTITVNGTPMLVSDDISFPFWLESGSSISPEVPVSSISVLEFNIVPNANGNDMVFNQVISVTEGQTVPEGKTWKVESILMENQSFDVSENNYPNLINNKKYLPIDETGLHLKFYEPNYISSIANIYLKADILPGGGGDVSHAGFCYSKSNKSPDLNDEVWYSDGFQIGTTVYTNLAVGYDLEIDTSYFVRAFVSNSEGITYSDTYKFETYNFYVGMEYEGGVIFYIDSTNAHGYVYSDKIYNRYGFNCNSEINTPYGFGSGLSNTNSLLESDCVSSSLLHEMTNHEGYSDWFLPSQDELIFLCNYQSDKYKVVYENDDGSFSTAYTHQLDLYDNNYLYFPDDLKIEFSQRKNISSTSWGPSTGSMYSLDFYGCSTYSSGSDYVILVRQF